MSEFDFDAVVVGAGAVGLACGYALSQRGLVVAVLEECICHRCQLSVLRNHQKFLMFH